MSKNYTFKNIVINDIYFMPVYMKICSYKLPPNHIILRIIFLLYNKPNIDNWYSNDNINVGKFYRVIVEYNIGKSDI